jgi:hypothetical protein
VSGWLVDVDILDGHWLAMRVADGELKVGPRLVVRPEHGLAVRVLGPGARDCVTAEEWAYGLVPGGG